MPCFAIKDDTLVPGKPKALTVILKKDEHFTGDILRQIYDLTPHIIVMRESLSSNALLPINFPCKLSLYLSNLVSFSVYGVVGHIVHDIFDGCTLLNSISIGASSGTFFGLIEPRTFYSIPKLQYLHLNGYGVVKIGRAFERYLEVFQNRGGICVKCF
jgi:hypothetical protein